MVKQRVLHVGCGSGETLHEVFAGWEEVRLDVDAKVKPDIVCSMTHMRPVKTGDYDAIFSRHNLEHLEYHEVGKALVEFRRVLKTDGVALIVVPDLETVAEQILEGTLEKPLWTSKAGPVAPIDTLYGHRPALEKGNSFMAHRVGFTHATLGKHLVGAGFHAVVVRSRKRTELWAEARTDETKADLLIRIFGNLPALA
ncbi:MAG TPA: methyltransferase domain-containing protein [Fimbriimonas sp.]|nr:methyltransferase domain-containing protein [Fimbriimonas sp.]